MNYFRKRRSSVMRKSSLQFGAMRKYSHACLKLEDLLANSNFPTQICLVNLILNTLLFRHRHATLEKNLVYYTRQVDLYFKNISNVVVVMAVRVTFPFAPLFFSFIHLRTKLFLSQASLSSFHLVVVNISLCFQHFFASVLTFIETFFEMP